MKFAIRIESDDRMSDVQEAIIKEDKKAIFDPEKNPVTIWVTTRLSLEDLQEIDGVQDVVVSTNQSITPTDAARIIRLIAEDQKRDDEKARVYEKYSGRNMFGRTCIGIVTEYPGEVEAKALIRGVTGAKTDNMGKSFIIYWPQIEG